MTSERLVDGVGAVLRERSYTYDADGNRLTRVVTDGGSANTETYSYGAGFRLASVSDSGGTDSYVHDAGGRVTSLRGTTLSYDASDNVTSVSDGSATIDYTFDGQGRRIGWNDGTISRDVLVAQNLAGNAPGYDTGYDSPLLVSESGGAPVRSYVYDGEHALMRLEDSGAGTEPTYYLRDAMGSVIALVDSSGARTARFDYDAFGAIENASGADAALPVDGDFRHHGMWLDRGVGGSGGSGGLYHVRHRSYDPETGRFVTRDPVEAGQSDPEAWMPYVANRNNPHVWRDPEGLTTLASVGNFAAHQQCA